MISDEALRRYIDASAALRGLAIPADCAPGVLSNLKLLLEHARIVADADQARGDPAELLRP